MIFVPVHSSQFLSNVVARQANAQSHKKPIEFSGRIENEILGKTLFSLKYFSKAAKSIINCPPKICPYISYISTYLLS